MIITHFIASYKVAIVDKVLSCGSTLFLLILLTAYRPVSVTGQRFQATAVSGLNAAQIDGDGLYGFRKLGLQAGARLSYRNRSAFDLSLEMLYSQRGSAVRYVGNVYGEKIHLQYLELPVILSLRDWFIEKDSYYKVRAEAGLSYGYLFGVTAPGYQEDYFRRHDVSWLIAGGIQLNKRVGFSLRYTSSFANMYKDPSAGASTLLGYFITLRGEYSL